MYVMKNFRVLCLRHIHVYTYAGQFADKPTRGQSGRGLANSQTAKMTAHLALARF